MSSRRPKSHVSLSPQRGDSSVLFIHEDQCPSSRASSIVLFGGFEEDDGDDAMSLDASDTEEWSKPAEDPATLLQSESDDFQPGLESELIRVLSKDQRLAQFSRKYKLTKLWRSPLWPWLRNC